MQEVAAIVSKSKLLSACADSDPSYDHSARSYRLGSASMRVLRLIVAAFIALNFFGWVTEARAASDCPCKKIAPNLCIPDPDCAHRYGWRSKSYARPTPGNSGNNPGFNPGNSNTRIGTDSGSVVVARPGGGSGRTAHKAAPKNGARVRILETGYSQLAQLGKEVPGYGLYSYAILPSDSRRGALFLAEVFKEIPSISDIPTRPAQVNIFYIPVRSEKAGDFPGLVLASSATPDKMGAEYTKSFYDFRMARALLDHVCNPPAASVRELCEGDLSRGPYIFTYASPASNMSSVPPPFLFVDLSDVHEQAFSELLAAFKAQVKRDDVSDQARIRTLRLTILQITLKAADWVSPVQKALADIVHSAAPGDDK
jgi:hypothetical protein